MRLVVVMCALLRPMPAAAQPADPRSYLDAVDIYQRTGDVIRAIVPLNNWTPKDFEQAVKSLRGSIDLKTAAMLHLEIGVALVGVSEFAAKQHFDIGDDMLGGLRRADELRREDPARLRALDASRALWLTVAGSAFIAIKDVRVAERFLKQARDLAPESAHVLTVFGMMDEVAGATLNPDDWQSLSQRERDQRNRIVSLGRAESAYRTALKFDAHYSLAASRLGHVLHMNGKIAEARELLDRAAADASTPFQRYVSSLYLGAVQFDQKDLTAARKSFETAFAIAPSSQPAVVALAHLELMSGRPDRAQAIARGFADTTVAPPWWTFKDGGLDLDGLATLRSTFRK